MNEEAKKAQDLTSNICPICSLEYKENESWIQCDAGCNRWYHMACVQVEEFEISTIDKFHCLNCATIKGPSIMKKQTNDHRHEFNENEAELNSPQTGSPLFTAWLQQKTLLSGEQMLLRLRGSQLTPSYMLKKGFTKPIIVENKEGLDMIVPDENFTIEDVYNELGGDYLLDVIDTRRQLSVKMSFKHFYHYMKLDYSQRPAIFNCISLELSHTKLNEKIRPPSIVNKLSWVYNQWPNCDIRPTVAKYCLMSMRGSYTDFHIDFGGTSVWYHVVSGIKQFYVIEPNANNLTKYEKWMNNELQTEEFFGDCVDGCYLVTLYAGQTFFIPSGWIHAVYTPEDSLVFGGNFLHSFSMSLQLEIHDIELRVQTPDKYLFPFFELTHWYAAPSVLKLLKDNLKEKCPPKYLIKGCKDLIEALRNWLLISRQDNNDENKQNSLYAPAAGLDCKRIIKDLSKETKRAEQMLEDGPCIIMKSKKKSKSDANTELLSNASLIEPLPNINSPGDFKLLTVPPPQAPQTLSTTSSSTQHNLHIDEMKSPIEPTETFQLHENILTGEKLNHCNVQVKQEIVESDYKWSQDKQEDRHFIDSEAQQKFNSDSRDHEDESDFKPKKARKSDSDITWRPPTDSNKKEITKKVQKIRKSDVKGSPSTSSLTTTTTNVSKKVDDKRKKQDELYRSLFASSNPKTTKPASSAFKTAKDRLMHNMISLKKNNK